MAAQDLRRLPLLPRGDENLCENALFTGWDVDGGFAEYMVAPAAFVYRLPRGMDDLAAAPLLCAGIIGYRCLRLVGIVGDDAGLPGDGGLVPRRPGRVACGDAPAEIGAEAEALAEERRADRASQRTVGRAGAGRRRRAAPPRPLRLRLGRLALHPGRALARLGGLRLHARRRAPQPGARARRGVGRARRREDPGVLLDAAIVFAPAGELAVDALRHLDKGGIVALGGIYSSPIPPIEYPWIYHERVVRSVANSTRQDARELLRDAALVPVRSRVQEYDLEQANEALLDLKEDRVRGSAVLRVS